MNRRNFITAGALAASALIGPFSLKANPNKLKLAILGTGSWGTEMLLKGALASGQFEIVALCDVNSLAAIMAAEEVLKSGSKKPKVFSSYHDMFELEGLQAVAIATPTHWHALQFIDACKKGLHVFLEKPICYDIMEGQAMLEAHRKANNVVQVDFPRVTTPINDEVKSFIQSGKAGKIYEVKANINHFEGPLVEKPAPQTLDIENFSGPVSQNRLVYYEDGIVPNWRGQHDFSRGIMVDWGIHYIHNIRQVFDLELPISVSAVGGVLRNFTQDNPDHLEVRYNFDGLPVYWSHKTWGYTSPIPDNDYGVYYYGEKATVFAGDLGWEVYPSGGKTKLVYGDVRFNPGDPVVWQKYRSMVTDLFTEFAWAVKNNSTTGVTNTLEDAYKTTSTVIYGDMAYLAKSNLIIDRSTMGICNNDHANVMLKRGYSPPYQHPHSS